jgi:peptidoglycan/xylan/chitin deacetylase (PgdA/CDA1 family)
MFRADRFVSLYAFHPLQRLRAAGKRIPFLMYHGISDSEEAGRHPYYRTTTAPLVFDRQLRFLNESGYQTVSLTEAVRVLSAPEVSVRKLVVITFDDGFRDFYSEAFPLLSKYGFTATMFLPTAYIDPEVRRFKGVDCLTWDQVRELHKAGMQFGSHTVTHPQLRSLEPASIRKELRCSKQTIEDQLGNAVASFSYPYAFPATDRAFRRQLGDLLEESGYENGVSTIIGTAGPTDEPFFMKRLPVNSCDDVRLFRAKLEGGYDWLRSIQYAAKVRHSGGGGAQS